MSEFSCYERREAPARFVAQSGEPKLCSPEVKFVGDHRPKYLTVDGDRHHVPAERQPKWALGEIAAAAAEGRNVLARKIGSAGKFSFWELVGRTLENQRKLCADSPRRQSCCESGKSSGL